MRRIRETGGVQHLFRCAGAEQGTEHIEKSPQRMGATGQRRRELRLQQRAFGNSHVYQVIEAVVEHDLRIHDVDRERTEEHLEHVFVQVEIH